MVGWLDKQIFLKSRLMPSVLLVAACIAAEVTLSSSAGSTLMITEWPAYVIEGQVSSTGIDWLPCALVKTSCFRLTCTHYNSTVNPKLVILACIWKFPNVWEKRLVTIRPVSKKASSPLHKQLMGQDG